LSRRHAVHADGRGRAGVVAVIVLVLALFPACAPEKQKELKPGQKAIILTGAVAPVQESEVIAPVGAVVSQMLVEPGQAVRAQQVIVRLDPAPYAAAVARAEASVALARAHLAQARSGAAETELIEARAEVERLDQELDRQRRLAAVPPPDGDLERAEIILTNARARLERVYALFARRLVSRPELEAAQNDYAEAWQRYRGAGDGAETRAVRDSDVRIAEARARAARARLAGLEADGGRRARVDAALAQVRQAEADLDEARYRMAQTIVAAPIEGTVTEVRARIGEKVAERAVLLAIKDISRVQVRADLSPGLLPHVRVGQEAMVTVNTVPPATETASVHRIQPVADPKTQSLGMTFILPNRDLRFQPGFTARVEIPIGAAQLGSTR
jgi:membrane fusion protein (multidrug efflux system)